MSAVPEDHNQQLRLLEAILFASADPVGEEILQERFGAAVKVRDLLLELQLLYENRGVNLVAMGGRWAFRTAPDLGEYLRSETEVAAKLSRAAVETLAIIAYHQPVTRAEIESIRGVATSKGTLDILMETGWIKPGRRRETPGRPLTWVTTPHFLDHFGLETLRDLPGVEDLRAAGLLDSRPAVSNLPGLAEKATAEADG
ncbi:SMC-Scp complex subunit ScpB [Oleisolibacter albus]|uniref:SMC-Scp complex subunit ScpB n=1 Tax=Oleisolibacter albus TaxID=2171757 RepID=UPI000DF2D84B|nr:SMC-Scp complex subunit ScpB [Oleisolibacter albus]